ncbi:MAG: cupin domain-containing protein [Thermoanaerobaculia bacterium]
MTASLQEEIKVQPQASLSLEDLISPTTLDDFFSRTWEKSLLILRRNDPTYYNSLMTLADFDRCLQAALDSPTKMLQVVAPPGSNRKSQLTAAADIPRDRLYEDYLSGNTLRLIGAEKYWPPIDILLASMRESFAGQVGANVFLTPPGSQGFSLHFDPVDSFIVQLAGSKRWHIWEPTYLQPMAIPISERYLDKIIEKCEEDKLTPCEEVLLEAGDVMYMPRGFYHKAIAQDELSLHITLYIRPLYWLDFFRRALELAGIEDLDLRATLPPHFAQDPALRKSMAETFKFLLGRIGDRLSFDAAYESLARDQVRESTFPADGHFALISNLEDVGLGTRIERRRGLRCLTENTEQEAMIRFGTNVVRGPAVLSAAFEFMRQNKSFRVSDLPDSLSRATKVALVRKMIQEGLLRVCDRQ